MVDLRTFGVLDTEQVYPYSFLPVGEYTISYRVDSNSTDPMKLEVVEPTGNEARALRQFLDAYVPINDSVNNRRKGEKRRRGFPEQVERLIAFVDSFPNSVYAAKALSSAETHAWNLLGDGELAYRLNKRLIREYGDPFMSGLEFFKLYYLMTRNDTLGFKMELDSLIRKSDNQQLIQSAHQKLKMLERAKKP
ncbi:MAG: hypothetical protein L0Y56_05745 [Nitrospira sp.]|nr:hypothetical protein [Nitrospira sp.]